MTVTKIACVPYMDTNAILDDVFETNTCSVRANHQGSMLFFAVTRVVTKSDSCQYAIQGYKHIDPSGFYRFQFKINMPKTKVGALCPLPETISILPAACTAPILCSLSVALNFSNNKNSSPFSITPIFIEPEFEGIQDLHANP